MKNTARLGLLAKVLQGEDSFVQRGFMAKMLADSLLVERHGHFHGMWTVGEDGYVWTAAGYSEPTFSTGSLPEALKYTLAEISKH